MDTVVEMQMQEVEAGYRNQSLVMVMMITAEVGWGMTQWVIPLGGDVGALGAVTDSVCLLSWIPLVLEQELSFPVCRQNLTGMGCLVENWSSTHPEKK